MKKYNCLQCGIEKEITHWKQRRNKFCGNTCQQQYRFENDTLPRFKQGLIKERSTLRNILAKLHGYKCSVCGISEWNSKPLTLQVDHVDGNAGNNKPENVRLLCPNCHTQTEFFSGRNKGNGRAARGLPLR